jgi:hypothetical protein
MNSYVSIRLKKTKNSGGSRRPDPKTLERNENGIKQITDYLNKLGKRGDGAGQLGQGSARTYTWYNSFQKKWHQKRKSTSSTSLDFEKGCCLYNKAAIESQMAEDCRDHSMALR